VRAAVPGAPVIGFPRAANALQVKSYAAETGVDAVSLDPSTTMNWAVEEMGKTVALQGNLDPLCLIAGGKALQSAVASILEATKDAPFIFNLGHGILPPTPIAHVEELVKLVRGAA